MPLTGARRSLSDSRMPSGVRLLLMLLSVMLGLPVQAMPDVRGVSDLRILELRASTLGLPPLPSAELSVVTWRDGAFQPVVFQIDPVGDADMVWFEESELDRKAPPEQFTGDDRLLLRLRDAAGRAPADASPPQGRILNELAVTGSDNMQRYFYIARSDPRRDGGWFVHHDLRTGTTITDSYQLLVDPDNELNWQYLGYDGYRGDGSIIDTLKMRMAAGFLNRHARVTLDNTNLRPTLSGYKSGPLRSVMHLETRVVLAGIPVMKLHVQAYRYPDHYEAHTYARVPGLYRRTLRAPEVSVTIDGHAQYGATVQTARGGPLRALVDGRIDDEEQQLIERGLTTDESWILFDSGKQFILLAELDVPDNLRGIPLALIYQDDPHLAVEPEQFTGQLPNLGYALRGWPQEQEMRFAVRMLFGSDLHGMAPEDYADARTLTPALQVTPWPRSASAAAIPSALPEAADEAGRPDAPGSTRTMD